MTLQLQKLTWSQEKRPKFLCTTCRVKGNHKNECPIMTGYAMMGAPNPIPQNHIEWCDIFQDGDMQQKTVQI